MIREGSDIRETLLDTTGDGRIDQREIHIDGRPARIEIDTTGNGVPDVIQTLDQNGRVIGQDEDTDGDGRIDRRFEGDQPIPIEGSPPVPERFPKNDCGQFDSFWKNH